MDDDMTETEPKQINKGSISGWHVGDFCQIKGVDHSFFNSEWYGCFTVTGCFPEGRLDVVNSIGKSGNFWPSELVNLSTSTDK